MFFKIRGDSYLSSGSQIILTGDAFSLSVGKVVCVLTDDFEKQISIFGWTLSKESSRFFPLILQQPLPQREDLDTVAILLHDILLVLCHDHHSLEALDGGKAYQPVRLPPQGLGGRHRITFLWFFSSNDCRRAYFGLSMESNDPTKLHIYFGLSHSPLGFLSWNRAGGGIYLIC